MNKVDFTKLGGDPLTLDDLEFSQNALTDGIRGLASIWQDGSSDPVIISGLQTTIAGSDTIWGNGYAVINKEVYFISGGTHPTASTIVIDIAQATDSNGDQTFEDLSVNSTYIIRQGTLKVYTGGPSEIDITDFISIKDRFSSLGVVVNLETAWTNVGVSPAFNGTWVKKTGAGFSGNEVRFKTTKTGDLEIDGIAYVPATTGSDDLVFVLPVGSRPLVTKFFSCGATITGSSTATTVLVSIFPNGEVHVYSSSAVEMTLGLNLRFPKN